MLKTTIVGSYPQPDGLIDRAALGSRVPPRVRARELWRVDPSMLVRAQDDATELAVRSMERIGLDRRVDIPKADGRQHPLGIAPRPRCTKRYLVRICLDRVFLRASWV